MARHEHRVHVKHPRSVVLYVFNKLTWTIVKVIEKILLLDKRLVVKRKQKASKTQRTFIQHP